MEQVSSSSSSSAEAAEVIDIPEGEGVAIAWRDILYEVDVNPFFSCFKEKKEKKVILNYVCGWVDPGELVAVMGPSGCGKSTLLDVLGGRIRDVSGDIYINGVKPKMHTLQRNSAYVMQDDALNGVLTVYENLWFSARLRLPRSMSLEEREARVEQVIQELGLDKSRDTQIGNALIRGISGGERRRVSIGMELIINPPLLLLDEPTSGLDSKSTRLLLEVLQNLARKKGKTVMCTIHQPSSYTFSLFSKVCLMCKGTLVFFGTIPETVKFFADAGHKFPKNTNPADFFIESIEADMTKEKDKAKMRIVPKTMKTSARASEIHYIIEQQVKDAVTKQLDNPYQKDLPAFQTSRWKQLWYLMHRVILSWIRNPLNAIGRIGMFISTALLVGLLFLTLDFDQNNLQDRICALCFCYIFLVFVPMCSIELFVEDREIFLRERMNGYYAVLPYAVAYSLVVNGFVAICAAIFSAIVYYMVQFNPHSEAFGYFLVNLVATLWCSEALVGILSTLVNGAVAGIALTASVFGVLVLTNGFFIRSSNIPGWWIWVHWSNFAKYSFEGTMVSEFTAVNFSCIPLNQSIVTSIPCTVDNVTLFNNCTLGADNTTVQFIQLAVQACSCSYPDLNRDCVLQGEELLTALEYDIEKWGWFAVTMGFSFLFRIIFYFCLRFLVTNKR